MEENCIGWSSEKVSRKGNLPEITQCFHARVELLGQYDIGTGCLNDNTLGSLARLDGQQCFDPGPRSHIYLTRQLGHRYILGSSIILLQTDA